MRVLLISGFFPPFAPMGGVRPSKLAKFLFDRGHDVRVLAARDLPNPPLLSLEIPEDRVVYAPWRDVNALPKKAAALLNRGSASVPAPAVSVGTHAESRTEGRRSGLLRSALRQASTLYVQATNWPDSLVGWVAPAVRAGTELLRHWPADLLYVSAPPQSGHLVGRRLARRFGIPWIAELRDLWVDHPYYDEPSWRRRIERRLEAAVLGDAAALVTVSSEWARLLEHRFGKRSLAVLNGFDPDDHLAAPGGEGAREGDPSRLEIAYLGGIYPGRRDPSPLFAAIARLGERRRAVRVRFYGSDPAHVLPLVARAGVEAEVEVLPPVPFREAVAIQRRADVLLLLRWADPSERGVVPGKLFEYMGARRPILCLGLEDGTVAEIIRARDAGFVGNDPAAIADRLAAWVDEKAAGGRIEALPETVLSGLSRAEQFAELEKLMEDVAAR